MVRGLQYNTGTMAGEVLEAADSMSTTLQGPNPSSPISLAYEHVRGYDEETHGILNINNHTRKLSVWCRTLNYGHP